MSCTSCGRPVDVDARFCPHCGTPQASVGEERRVVTVLFADIVGFTALSEHMDPEEVKHLVDRAFERLARDITAFGGVVDKVLGDGIIALFGAPVAHEDDAERAVRAGLRMQQSIQALSADVEPTVRMRVGVNTGEVLVGTITTGGDYTAMGDVMNSADRLQGLAEPGETLVGEATRVATGDAIAYRSAGLLPARGREEPIEAWVALRANRPPGLHRQRGSVFVGRNHEMEMLSAQSLLAVEGERAQLSLVVGEAGMGKTRLVNESAAAMARMFGARVIEGRCLPYGEANVWWPVADLVRNLFGVALDVPQAEAEEHLRSALLDHLADATDNIEDEVDRYLVALIHALGYETALRGGDRDRNRSEVMLAFTTVMEAEVIRRPVVLVLSDMHWAAAPIWQLVNHLLSELARSRLIVLMTARPSSENRIDQGRHGVSVIQLGPLDSLAAMELLGELGLELGDGGAKDLVDRSGGNPFFLEELASLVAKDGEMSSEENSEFDIRTDQLPATLRGIIAARLDALGPRQRALLEAASVLGRSGPIEGLVTLALQTLGIEDMSADLAQLVEADLLEMDGRRFRFRSNLVRDVAYGRLTKTSRSRQHLGIAEFLEHQQEGPVRNSVVVAIADHYRAAAQLSSEVTNVPGIDRAHLVSRALYWLEQAGERALDVGAPLQAVRWFDYGIDLAGDEAEQAKFVFGRARARSDMHDVVGARSDLERLDGLVDLDPVMMAKALMVQGEVDRKAGDLDRAAARLREAADRLAGLNVHDQQATALRLLGLTEMGRADDALARRALESSRSVALAAGDRRSEAWALQAMAWHAFRCGRVLDAGALADEAVGIFSELDDQGGLVWAHGVMAWVAVHTCDWEEARRLVDAVLPETRRRADPRAETMILNLDSSLQLWTGQAQKALDLTAQAKAAAERMEDSTLAVQSRAIEGRALVSLGRIDEGTSVLEEAFSFADQVDDKEGRRVAVIINCASAARLGEPERAIRWAARYDGLHDDPMVVGEADLVVSLALAMLQRGAVAEAASQLLWVDTPDSERFGHYADAVGALIAAAKGETVEAERLVARTLAGQATYLDRVFALLARAALRRQIDDVGGCQAALDDASALVEATDDQPTRHLVSLVSGICGLSLQADAEARMRSAGLDPSGWTTAFALAARTSSRTTSD